MSVYNDLTPVLDSVPLRNAETWSDLIIFLLNLMTISSNTIQIALLDLQTESWDQLTVILSDFTTISRNLGSVATIFSIASSRPAMRNAQQSHHRQGSVRDCGKISRMESCNPKI